MSDERSDQAKKEAEWYKRTQNHVARNLGARIRNLRERKGESQMDLALATHLKQQTLSAIELGKRMPKPPIIAVLADHFEMTPAELIADIGWTGGKLRVDGSRATVSAKDLGVNPYELLARFGFKQRDD